MTPVAFLLIGKLTFSEVILQQHVPWLAWPVQEYSGLWEMYFDTHTLIGMATWYLSTMSLYNGIWAHGECSMQI